MHANPSQLRPNGHFDSLAARKYPKILVTIRSIVCYSIANGGGSKGQPQTRREHTMRTALVRNENGNLHIIRDDWFDSNKEFAEDLRGNGFKVLKVWAKNVSDREVEEWEFVNRK